MKTLTEFPAMNLKLAAKTQQDLVSSGKTTEELPTALGEALKIEGDRLSLLTTALSLVGTRHTDLKRVVVFTLNEGEKAPHGAIQKESHYFLVEYYPSLDKPKPQGNHPGKRDDGKRRGKSGRRGPPRIADGKPGRTDSKEGSGEGFRPRTPRPPRPPRAPVVNSAPGQVIIKPRTTPLVPVSVPVITPVSQPVSPAATEPSDAGSSS